MFPRTQLVPRFNYGPHPVRRRCETARRTCGTRHVAQTRCIGRHPPATRHEALLSGLRGSPTSRGQSASVSHSASLPRRDAAPSRRISSRQRVRTPLGPSPPLLLPLLHHVCPAISAGVCGAPAVGGHPCRPLRPQPAAVPPWPCRRELSGGRRRRVPEGHPRRDWPRPGAAGDDGQGRRIPHPPRR